MEGHRHHGVPLHRLLFRWHFRVRLPHVIRHLRRFFMDNRVSYRRRGDQIALRQRVDIVGPFVGLRVVPTDMGPDVWVFGRMIRWYRVSAREQHKDKEPAPPARPSRKIDAMLQRIHHIGRSAAAMAVQQRLGRRCPYRRDAQHTGAAKNQLMRRRNAPFAQLFCLLFQEGMFQYIV